MPGPLEGITVVDVTSALLGDKYNHVTQHFETMRRKRNEMTYEAGGPQGAITPSR